ncbi:hypothetical protein ACOME3_000354 [Neoechinorhynchus agilis]
MSESKTPPRSPSNSSQVNDKYVHVATPYPFFKRHGILTETLNDKDNAVQKLLSVQFDPEESDWKSIFQRLTNLKGLVSLAPKNPETLMRARDLFTRVSTTNVPILQSLWQSLASSFSRLSMEQESVFCLNKAFGDMDIVDERFLHENEHERNCTLNAQLHSSYEQNEIDSEEAFRRGMTAATLTVDAFVESVRETIRRWNNRYPNS